MNLNTIYTGDALEVLRTLPDGSVDCCITSPPYWGLRDYNVFGQLGQEDTPELYLQALLAIFNEIRRVLKPGGTCFVNLGDTYSGNKSLLITPYRFAWQMIEAGWVLRNIIVWHKPNQMPSGAKDRFTVDFEPVFFFSKEQQYYFAQQLESYTKPLNRWTGDDLIAKEHGSWASGTGQKVYRNRNMRPNPAGRNMRTVWSVNTVPFKGAHFAAYPEKLVERMLLAGCPPGGVVLDPFFGAGTTGLVARNMDRNYIGIELNAEYVKMAEKRLVGDFFALH
jgi:site-specific DNA-methyltransferase (adenine-specific)